MNDFDRYLERQLRRMLDPVVATPAPRRMGPRVAAGRPILTVAAPIDRAAEAIPVVEPVPGAFQASAPPL